VLPRGDRLWQTRAEAAAAGHRYALVSWELVHAPSKWLHRIYTAMPWSDTGPERRKADLARYLEIAAHIRAAQGRLDEALSLEGGPAEAAAQAQADLDRLHAERDGVRDSVEEYLEAALSAVLVETGLNVAGGAIWPPVDFRLDETPDVLVTSARDRISRLDSVLISPEISAKDADRIESNLQSSHGLSAIVERTGGVATYPTVITSDRDLLGLLEVAAHEWLHSYLYFHGLGQSYGSSADMTTLNETLADMAGRELGGMAYEDLTGEKAPEIEPPRTEAPAPSDPEAFDFFRFMRETRVEAERLLAAGQVTEAENYMESRRVELNTHGYRIRKINQAYFAFHGSYGESPSSVSPIAAELYELRTLLAGPGELVRALRGVRTIGRFREILSAVKVEAG
jgi:hypothetical protein